MPRNLPDITYAEEVTGFHFIDRVLFQQAFVHRSYVNETESEFGDNERLEFLGDSVLGFVVSQQLYRRFPEYDEGGLTRLRSMLVRRATLARLALDLRLNDHLLLGNGEEESGGRNRPATLCALYEAFLGAAYIDQGFDATRDLILTTLKTVLHEVIEFNLDQDPKSRLQEYIQGLYNETPRYQKVRTDGPDHAKHFVTTVRMRAGIIGVGQGYGKKIANQKAAAMALSRLSQHVPEYEPDKALESEFDFYDPAASDSSTD